MSGFLQRPGSIQVPSSEHIAIVSGRICRYAGNLPCTLLTHVMVGARVVWRLMQNAAREKRLMTFAWWMLHDAHEVITGDHKHKSTEMKAWQGEIDTAMRTAFYIDERYVDRDVIKLADLLCRWLEADHYGPPEFMRAFVDADSPQTLRRLSADSPQTPSLDMIRETNGVFHSAFGMMDKCLVEDNDPNTELPFSVQCYTSMLESIRSGDLQSVASMYDGWVVSLGL